jgi:hypothetical protein
MPILLMTAKTVFQVVVKSFHFPQTTPEGIKTTILAFLRRVYGLLLQTYLSYLTI